MSYYDDQRDAEKLRKLNLETATLPAFLASALVNGDTSGFDDNAKDVALYEQVLAYLEGFAVVDCGEEFFGSSDCGSYRGGVCEYTLMPIGGDRE